MDAEQLTLGKMTFDGIPYDDDWLVIWRGLPIGRILKQSGVAYGQPDWWWGIDFDHGPQPTSRRGNGRDLAECQAAFKKAWAAYRPSITDAAIEKVRRTS